jgi:hypothetical protein
VTVNAQFRLWLWRETQFRSGRGRRRRSFGPPRDGKCAVSAGGLRDAQYRPDGPIADGLGAWPTCCAVSTLMIHRHEAVNAQCRSVAYVIAKAYLPVDEAVWVTCGPDWPEIVGCVGATQFPTGGVGGGSPRVRSFWLVDPRWQRSPNRTGCVVFLSKAYNYCHYFWVHAATFSWGRRPVQFATMQFPKRGQLVPARVTCFCF